MKKQLVFVKHDIMLGDADGSVDGFAIMEKDLWEKEKKVFIQHLKDKGCNKSTSIEIESNDMYGYVSLKDYKEKDCTEEEAEVIKKFFADPYVTNKCLVVEDEFRWLTQWIPGMDEDDTE